MISTMVTVLGFLPMAQRISKVSPLLLAQQAAALRWTTIQPGRARELLIFSDREVDYQSTLQLLNTAARMKLQKSVGQQISVVSSWQLYSKAVKLTGNPLPGPKR